MASMSDNVASLTAVFMAPLSYLVTWYTSS
jgi:hypothetical protein